MRPDDSKPGEKRLKDLLESGRYEGEYRWLRADGAPLRVAGVIVDITESKNAESRIGAKKRWKP